EREWWGGGGGGTGCGGATPRTSRGPISLRFASRRNDRETSTPPTPASRTSAAFGSSSGPTTPRPRRQPTRALTFGPLPGATREHRGTNDQTARDRVGGSGRRRARRRHVGRERERHAAERQRRRAKKRRTR